MKKLLLFAMIAFMALPMLADINGDGFYRVCNAKTKRYAYLLDDKGSYSVATTSADVAALKLYADKDRVVSDPSAVFYLNAQGNDYYDICGQGTSIYTFMGEYLTILKDRNPYEGENAYYIYAAKSGLVKYLGDIWDYPDEDEGLPSVDATGDSRKWYIRPVDAASDEFFGVEPTVTVGDKYYAPFFAAFPFSANSDGLRFFTINEIDPRGAAIINEVSGTVAPSTPIIVECSSRRPSDNRLNIGGSADGVAGNKLVGTYFDNPSNFHYNRVPFDHESMRVLGLSKDGRLAFVKSTLDFLPRNKAVLKLSDPEQYSVDEFLVLTDEERNNEFSAVSVIPTESLVDVYSLDGRLIKAGIAKSDVNFLGKGLYILKGAGISEKMIVR